eukprot:gene28336-31457_t
MRLSKTRDTDHMPRMHDAVSEAAPFGICLIVPPPGFKPARAIDFGDKFRFPTRVQMLGKLAQAVVEEVPVFESRESFYEEMLGKLAQAVVEEVPVFESRESFYEEVLAFMERRRKKEKRGKKKKKKKECLFMLGKLAQAVVEEVPVFESRESFYEEVLGKLAQAVVEEVPVFESRESFYVEFPAFMERRGRPIRKAPVFAGKELDLFELYDSVQRQGGYQDVTAKQQWREVAKMLKELLLEDDAVAVLRDMRNTVHTFEADELDMRNTVHTFEADELDMRNTVHTFEADELALDADELEPYTGLDPPSQGGQEPYTGLDPPHKIARCSSMGLTDPLAKPSTSQCHDRSPEAPLNGIPGLGGDPMHCKLCMMGGKKGEGMIAAEEKAENGMLLDQKPGHTWMCPSCKRAEALLLRFWPGHKLSLSEFKMAADSVRQHMWGDATAKLQEVRGAAPCILAGPHKTSLSVFKDGLLTRFLQHLGVDAIAKVSHAQLEAEFWKLVESSEEGMEVLVASDLDLDASSREGQAQGGLGQLPAWSALSQVPTSLSSILRGLPSGTSIPGVTSPWLSIGMLFSFIPVK